MNGGSQLALGLGGRSAGFLAQFLNYGLGMKRHYLYATPNVNKVYSGKPLGSVIDPSRHAGRIGLT
jgi:hypothetical protein